MENLEALKKLRTPTRTNLTKIINKSVETLGKSTEDADTLATLIVQLEQKFKELNELDKQILEILQNDKTCKQDTFDLEYESIAAYEERYLEIKTKLERQLSKVEKPLNESRSLLNESRDTYTPSRKFKLPELELKQFSGDIKEWLSFWGQFKKIHDDPDIEDEDKFQYLIQATLKGSRAREVVESFPPTAKNYKEAIECLTSRFGRNDILIEVYVRELLSLVMNNVMGQKQKYSLVKLYDRLETQLRSLKMLGVASNEYASILYPLVESCLPVDILRIYERGLSSREGEESKSDKLSQLMSFLKTEIENEQKITLACSRFGFDKVNTGYSAPERWETYSRKKPSAADLFNSSENKKEANRNSCVFCNQVGAHSSESCKYALTIPYEKRKQILTERGACFKCLRFKPGHLCRTCPEKIKCSCGGSHFLIMCQKNGGSACNTKASEKKSEKTLAKETTLTNKTCMRQVYLQTLVAEIRGENRNKFVRVLIDTGSQRSYISKYVANYMGYTVISKESIVHSLFGGVEKSESHRKYIAHLSDVRGSFHCNFEVLDQETICSNISRVELSSFAKELKTRKVFLTDTVQAYDSDLLYEFSSFEVHVLIGSDIAGKLFTGRIEELSCGLVCVETRLGWTIMGKTMETERHDSTNIVLSLHVNEAKISDLWRLDTLGINDPSERKTREELEQAAKEHFYQTVSRNDEGRYVVRLPWVEGHPPISDCRKISEKRLANCVKSLEKLGKIEDYENVFKDWLEQGIIEEVFISEKDDEQHFLPHRAVFKENSTTKIRPVFDGSAKDKNSPSINDCLEKGPNLVELIPSVLNRFRLGKYGIVADIEKAFLQIEIHEHDRPYLRFLWLNNGQKENLRIFQHKRVVFGISSSPFLLGATLEFHVKNAPKEFQETAQKLLKSFYVDNAVLSVNDEEKLNKFIYESQEILRPAKFNLRGWEHTPITKNESTVTQKIIPVLGLRWTLKDDTLSVDVKELNFAEEDQPVTKRSILSTVHKIFDPIGFTCPITLMPKLLLQECWKLKLTWDSHLPSTMAKKFIKWKNHLKNLSDISIPRCLARNEKDRKLTLHVFCDASEKAYASCVILRCEINDSTDCQLIQARSRVAPLKSVSISRLELLACSIGARLCQTVKESLGMEEVTTRYWSDSSNALYWIKKNENWATFVYNRVKEIHQLSSPDDWYHIPGNLNPADLPSRGCSIENLAKSNWWQGPSWLKNSPDQWPESKIFPEKDIINAEKKKTVVSVTNTENEVRIYDNFSSYPKLLMVVAWIYRFFENCKLKKTLRKLGNITVEERNRAEISLIKLVQRESFTGLQDKRLQKLQITVDESGLYRVKTRLSLREDSENFKFPIVLPSEHPIVGKIVRWKHCSLGHAGVQTVMTALREEFWILKYRKTVRKTVKNCVTCRRFDSRPIETPTAPLPADRIRSASVFEITGIDFAGPLYLKGKQKCWIVIYTCAVFRAIHLELTTSLSTESFLQSFRRLARRGRPSIVYSDNGTNFVGASNLIKKIDWDVVAKYGTVNKINWKFIPPSAPWWGGWWERLIGVVKRILRKVLGLTSLNFEELSTVICDCESIVNGRPLTYVSDDTTDLSPLTPSMFLQEITETGIPDLDAVDSKSLNKTLSYRQRLRNDLRKRFRSEYLGQLRESSKKKRKSEPVKVGDVVLIGCDNLKRLDWPLGRAVEIFTSADGEIRLVRLKTKNGEVLRPTLRLYPLEVSSHENDISTNDILRNRSTSDKLDETKLNDFDKSESAVPTSLFGRRLKAVERLMM